MIGSVTIKVSAKDAKLVADALHCVANELTRDEKTKWSTDLRRFALYGVDLEETCRRLEGAFKTAWLATHVSRS